MKKTCPRCDRQVRHGAARCRGCGFRFPEKSGPRPAGLAMGVGFPLVTSGVLLLFIQGTSTAVKAVAVTMVLVGVILFFDPR